MTQEKRRILVTGGAGFIASWVAETFRDEGHEVWVVDDLSTGKRSNLPQGVEFLEADIQSPEVARLIQDFRPNLISHHAAQIDVRISVEDPARDARTNIMGLLNLLEAAAGTGVDRFVYVSSGGVVYGDPEQIPTPETAPKLPLSPYGVSKLTGEYYLAYYRDIRGLDSVALRYANVYGPRQDPHGEAGVVAIFCNRLLSGDPIFIFGDGEQTRDYVHVMDVVAANMRVSDPALQLGPSMDERAFNVGTGEGTSVNRLADLLEAASGRSCPREFKPPRAGELRHSTLDASQIRGLGWAPGRTLLEGLANTYQHIAREAAAASGSPQGTERGGA